MDSQQEYIKQLENQVKALQATIETAYNELLKSHQPDRVIISNTMDILMPRPPLLATPHIEKPVIESPRYEVYSDSPGKMFTFYMLHDSTEDKFLPGVYFDFMTAQDVADNLNRGGVA